MTDEHPTVGLARKLRYDLTAMQAKVTELLIELAKLDLEATTGFKCAVCGIARPTEQAVRDHIALIHGIEVAQRPRQAPQ